jgi:Na+-transporting methylmalonyl-CoA/oxaloacetate decarboxylase gamma subunit
MSQMVETSSTFVQGLYVMGAGMAVVFAALTLVMLTIMGLDRVFRVQTEATPQLDVQRATPAVPEPAVSKSAAPKAALEEGELAAVIGLAIALRLQEMEEEAVAPVKVMAVREDAQVWAAVSKLP